MKISLISSKVTLSFLIFLIAFFSSPPALSFIPIEKVAFKGGDYHTVLVRIEQLWTKFQASVVRRLDNTIH